MKSESARNGTALICVTRNNQPLLKATVDSITRNTHSGSYDLVIIDNGSTDSTPEYCAGLQGEHLIVVRNQRNLRWVGGINQGLDLTRNYHRVAFLNDDIEVGEGWLHNMGLILDCNPEVGAVGPITSHPRDWQCYDRVRGFYPHLELPPLDHIDRHDVAAMQSSLSGNQLGVVIGGMLAFFCTLFPRSVIDQIGYLDTDFTELMLGDDDEYCHRLQQSGRKIALCTNSYVLHKSGTSSLNVPDLEERRHKAVALILAKRQSHTI